MSGLGKIVSNFKSTFAKRTQPGARPGTIVVDPKAPPPRMHVATYGPDGVDEKDVETVEQLRGSLKDGRVTWVNVDGLGDAQVIKQLGELFSLHPLVMEDIVHVHQRAKVEEFDQHLYVVVRMMSGDGNLQSEQVSLILGEGFVLTLQERVGDCLDPVRQRIRSGGGLIRKSKADYLAYAIIDAVLDGYFPVLERYSERLDELENELITRPGHNVITRIHRMRSELYMLRKSVWPHREAVNALLRDSTPFISSGTRIFLRDCYDHAIQLIDIVETSREMCSDLRDFHFTQVSMRQNEVMKVLTIMATIFIPLGFVAGVYGMNFDSDVSPWNMPELKWVWGYPFALGLMGTMAFSMVGFFWYRGWLGHRPNWLARRMSVAEKNN